MKGGASFLWAGLDGDVLAARNPGEGLYWRDTRVLSELHLSLNGVTPRPLSHSIDRGYYAVLSAVNPKFVDLTGARIPEKSLRLTRTLLIDQVLYIKIEVANRSSMPVVLALQLDLAADFADLFEVRRIHGRVVPGRGIPKLLDSGVSFGFAGRDGAQHETAVEVNPPATTWQVAGARVHATWELTLAPGTQRTTLVTATPAALTPTPAAVPARPMAPTPTSAAPRPAPTARRRPDVRASFEQVKRDLDREADEWRSGCSAIEAQDARLQAVLAASVRDLYMLLTPARGGFVAAAGIPWYVALFGRDSLLTAYQCLLLNPQLARDTLIVLAGLQARENDPWRDAEPGKIPHELRCGELARAGVIPQTPYYGTVDATPLFVMLAAAFFRWTGDTELLLDLGPAIDAALAWIDEHGDADGDGFVEYRRRSTAGLENHGWKDSPNAIVHRDGTRAEGAIALVEVQGYVYAAKQSGAELYEALGETARAGQLRAQAAALRSAFNDAFWDPQEESFVLALDGQKRQVRSVSSNPGHCLLCGIVDGDKAGPLVKRLMAPDMFSGWGVRTLSSRSVAYDPTSYHNGSVWPHDNAIIAAGLKRYGYGEASARIAAAVLEVATRAPDHRLPELYCGFDRHPASDVIRYPASCRPQAWAATTPFMLLQTMIGLSPHALTRRVFLADPELPEWLSGVELRNLRVGQERVELAFRQRGGLTRLSTPSEQVGLRVTTTMAPCPPT